jgi:multisubunit Na+/H+ antiporter MnhB subunit
MLANEQIRIGARALAAIFGGPGIFYLWLGLSRPDAAMTGAIYLVIALALSLVAEESSARGGSGVLARCRAAIRPAKRRR